MSNFTTGPWIYDGVAFVEDKDNNRIAMTYRTQDGCCDCNGRLIAKAPEMYDWLKLVVHLIDEAPDLQQKLIEFLEGIDNARNDET